MQLAADTRLGPYEIVGPIGKGGMGEVYRARDTMTRYITGFENSQPVWAPIGDRVVFSSNRSGTYDLYWQEADGGAPVERLTTSELSHWPYAWSPDGAWLAFVEQHPETGADIWLLPIDDRVARPLVRSPANESQPYFSSDGRFIAYVSDETGQNEIYLTRFPDGGRAWRVSTSGGFNPLWNPNVGEILYRNGDEILAVDADVDARGVPRPSRPRLLFRLEGNLGGPTDITADGPACYSLTMGKIEP